MTKCKHINGLVLSVLFAIFAPAAECFSAEAIGRRHTFHTGPTSTLGVAAGNDFGSAIPDEVDPHDIIGVEPDLLAIGINPDEFLEWIGTKNDLMDKFQADFKYFTEEQIEKEVAKFMMDAENVNMYIKYLKDKKENPEKYAMEALEAELSLSNPKTLATYAAWLIGGVSFGAIRQKYIDPKFESGEWKGITLELPFLSNAKSEETVDAAMTLTSKATTMLVEGHLDVHGSLDLLG